MTHLKRTALLCAALLALGRGAAFPLSMLRPGEPRFKFNKLVAPVRADAGDEFKIVAFVTPLQNIWDDERIFIHLITPDAVMKEYPAQGWHQKGIAVNANTAPGIPSQRWIVGEDVQLGPVTIELPRGLAPGKYLVQMGLFHVSDPAREIFVREPYVNKEISDWIVGSIEIGAPRQARHEGRLELMLSDFETLGDVKKWESGRRGELGLVGPGEALAGDYSGCLAFPTKAYLPIVMLQSFFESAAPEYTDWDQYDYLEFLFQGEFVPGLMDAGHIAIQVKDAGGARFQRQLSDLERDTVDNAARAEMAEPGAGTAPAAKGAPPSAAGGNGADAPPRELLKSARRTPAPGAAGNGGEGRGRGSIGAVYRMRLPIVDIASRVDISNIRHLGYWAWGLPEEGEWYLTGLIDDVKLVAEKGKKPDWSEPFVVFEGIECPESATPGSAIKISAEFTIARKFRQDYSLFIHVIREDPPHYTMQVERNPFRSTSTWEVGRRHSEGPIYVPVPQDAPPGRYFINMGFFKTRDDQVAGGAYVNTYCWSDGIYTEEQPLSPVDYIKQPYLNRNSKEKWTVGRIDILQRGRARSAAAAGDEAREMEGLIRNTQADILSKPAPANLNEPPRPAQPAVKRIDEGGEAPPPGPRGE